MCFSIQILYSIFRFHFEIFLNIIYTTIIGNFVKVKFNFTPANGSLISILSNEDIHSIHPLKRRI